MSCWEPRWTLAPTGWTRLVAIAPAAWWWASCPGVYSTALDSRVHFASYIAMSACANERVRVDELVGPRDADAGAELDGAVPDGDVGGERPSESLTDVEPDRSALDVGTDDEKLVAADTTGSSPSRRVASSRRAAISRTLSPAACPRRSLTCLNSLRSTNMIAVGAPRSRLAARAWRRAARASSPGSGTP